MVNNDMQAPGKAGKGIWLAALLVAAVLAGALQFLIFAVNAPVELIRELTIEAGDPVPPAEAFLQEGEDAQVSYASDMTQVQSTVPGDYSVLLTDGRRTYPVCIRIVDTVAPVGTVQDLTALQADMPSAADFVTDMWDATPVTAAFEHEPDANIAGEQTVTILLSDTSGNVTKLQAVLTVIIDNEAPVIAGVQDFLLYQGETVAYRSGVTVTDNVDPAPELTVDSSMVDLSKAGQYIVRYIATDASGNTTTVSATVTVLEKKETYVALDVINEEVDSLLATIIKDGMTDRDKTIAIYRWVRRYCGYVDSSDKDDWRQAGYQMIVTRRGDCFGYFAACKLMLERLEIPNIDVVKVPNYEGDSHHYWSLVSVDGGETYYHLDATPRLGDDTEFLLVTDAFLDAYSEDNKNCFNRDKSLYPATP